MIEFVKVVTNITY